MKTTYRLTVEVTFENQDGGAITPTDHRNIEENLRYVVANASSHGLLSDGMAEVVVAEMNVDVTKVN